MTPPEAINLTNFDPGTASDLEIRISTGLKDPGQQIGLIVGAGLSAGAVAGVTDINKALVKALSREFGAEEVDGWFQGLDQGLLYQNAASRAGRALGSDSVNKIIRAGVLRACTSMNSRVDRSILSDEQRLEILEYQGAWDLPVGVAALGRLLTRFPEKLMPVITTNFDPLIEVAVREAGGTATSVLLDDKGHEKQGIDHSAQVRIHHVHGFWRDGDTLNTVRQLTGSRPGLRAFLRNSLEGAAVLTLGYSGWDDAFMRSLRDRIEERNELDLEMLWSQYSDDPQRLLDHPALGEFATSPRTYFYIGVDANQLLPNIENRVRSAAANTTALKIPAGWRHIDASSPDPHPARKGLAFGMGGHPTWRDAADEQWPVLSSTQRAYHEVLELLDSYRRVGGLAILAPTGEGKSMAIRQVANLAAAARPELTVISQELGTRLTPEVVDWGQRNGPTLIVIDDIDLVFQDAMFTRSRWAAPGSSVTILAACQTRYWASLGLAQLGLRTVEMSGVSLDDCMQLAAAWRAAGPQYEGELASLELEEAGRRLFDSAAATIGQSQRPSLLGAILHTRDASGFRDRIADLLISLRRAHPLGSSDHSLYDLFIAICIDQQHGHGLDLQTAAEVMGTDTEMLTISALPALAREAAITMRNDRVTTRHPMIARTALSLARTEFNEDWETQLKGLVTAFATQAARAPDRHVRRMFERKALLCRRLDGNDAVITALRIADALPRSLWIATSAMKALRINGRPDVARDLGMARLTSLVEMEDRYEHLRIFLNEFGVVHGNLGRWEVNGWLSLLSISDQLTDTAPITPDTARVSMQCSASALIKLCVHGRSSELESAVSVLDAKAAAAGLHDQDWLEIGRFVDRLDKVEAATQTPREGLVAAASRLSTNPDVQELANLLGLEVLSWKELLD